MAMSMGGGGASAPQMNVTPLIDVLLVLIIIFMVIVAQSKEKGFNADIPQPPAMPDVPQPVRTIVIQLGRAEERSKTHPQNQSARGELGGSETAARKHFQAARGESRVRARRGCGQLRVRRGCHRYRAGRGRGACRTSAEGDGFGPLNVKISTIAAHELRSGPSAPYNQPSGFHSNELGSCKWTHSNSEYETVFGVRLS